jgi:hypothetical protein
MIPFLAFLAFLYGFTGLCIWLCCIDKQTGAAPKFLPLLFLWPLGLLTRPESRIGTYVRDLWG